MLAESPPSTEKNEAFFARGTLCWIWPEVKVPTVLGADLDRGFLLLEDLGDQLLWPALNTVSVDNYYTLAFDVLSKMAAVKTSGTGLDPYNRSLLGEELGRFQQWFVMGLLGI